MGLFKSEEEVKMDELINSIEINMQNNYKDNAQASFAKFVEIFDKAKASGKIKEKKMVRYEQALEEYSVKLKGYSHKDQKPYWT